MADADVVRMSSTEKVGEAMRRSLPHLPASARGAVEGLLEPATLALIAGTLVVWAGSHFFGIGEIVDVILLVVGVVALGFSVFEGAGALYDFATTAINARSEAELETAGQHFARAVVILGISTVQAVLLRGQSRAVVARGRPTIHGRIRVGNPPAPGTRPVTRPSSLPGGTLGTTSEYGIIQVARNQSLTEQRLTLLHELVHRFFSPKSGPLLRLRAELNISSYSRSAILRYLEEAMAEGYAQLRVNGLLAAIRALRFPLAEGYMTISQIAGEGSVIGTITLGGTLFYVSITKGPLPANDP